MNGEIQPFRECRVDKILASYLATLATLLEFQAVIEGYLAFPSLYFVFSFVFSSRHKFESSLLFLGTSPSSGVRDDSTRLSPPMQYLPDTLVLVGVDQYLPYNSTASTLAIFCFLLLLTSDFFFLRKQKHVRTYGIRIPTLFHLTYVTPRGARRFMFFQKSWKL